MDEPRAALDAPAAEDLTPAFGPALLDRLRPLLVAQNRLPAEVAHTVRECAVSGAAEVDGLETMGWWLREHGHLSPAEAARVVRAGRALEHLPATAEAFSAGQVTGEQAGLIAPVAEPRHLAQVAEQGVDPAAVDAVLADVATRSPSTGTGRLPVRRHGHRAAREDTSPGGPLAVRSAVDGGIDLVAQLVGPPVGQRA